MNNEKKQKVDIDYEKDKKFIIKLGILIFLFSFFILCIGIYLFLNSNKKSGYLAPTDTPGIMLNVNKLIDLPKGESPQVVVITDISQFRQQAFFNRGKVGDVLIVYKQNHVAILYDPETDKIINMSSISVLLPKPAALP